MNNSLQSYALTSDHAPALQDYRDMRMVSDRLCKEYQLSVVQQPEQGKGKHYVEWQAEQEGKPSYHSMVKADVDEATDS